MSLETTAIPYLHKTLKFSSNLIEPFFSLPVGLSFFDGNYRPLATAIVGSLFHHSSHFSTALEMGLALSHSNTYFSGGFVYYH